MKRLSVFAAGLLVIATFIGGCAYQPYGPAQLGWVNLFDGSNLNNFALLGAGNWRLQDGYAQADLAGGPGSSFLVSKKSYNDFHLRAEFWVDETANSGIFIRCTNPKEIVGTKTAYEVNIFDTRPDTSYGTGAIVDVAKVNPMPRAGGQWSTMEIIAQGPAHDGYFQRQGHGGRRAGFEVRRRPDRVAIRPGCRQVPQGRNQGTVRLRCSDKTERDRALLFFWLNPPESPSA